MITNYEQLPVTSRV